MSLPALPTELLLAVFHSLPSQRDVAALAQTCHHLYDLLIPELYHLSFQHHESDILYWAAEYGYSRVVQLFLAANSHLGLQFLSPYMNCALSLAAQHGQISVVNTLLAMEGVDPDNTSNTLQRTPLSYAAQGAYIEIVRSLLTTNCVDPNSTDNLYGRSPLIWAVRYPLDEADLTSRTAASVVRSAEDRSIPVIQLLLENGANIEFLDYDCRNALYWATAGGLGSSAVVRLLLQKGARPDGYVDEKQRAMVKSIQWTRKQQLDGSSYLVQGINLPLQFAAWAGYDEVVQTLLEFGADVDCIKISGSNLYSDQHPLCCAAEKGYLLIVRLLIERGACPESSGSPLRCAARNGHVEMVQLLLDEMMHHCRQIEEEGKICKRKKRKHVPGNQAILSLPDAVISGNVEVVRLLLTVPGFDINDNFLLGPYTPLMIAVRAHRPSIEMIKVLLAAEGIEIRINEPQDSAGNTVLTWVIHRVCDEEIIHLLIDHGAVPTREPLRVELDLPQDGQMGAPLLTDSLRIQEMLRRTYGI